MFCYFLFCWTYYLINRKRQFRAKCEFCAQLGLTDLVLTTLFSITSTDNVEVFGVGLFWILVIFWFRAILLELLVCYLHGLCHRWCNRRVQLFAIVWSILWPSVEPCPFHGIGLCLHYLVKIHVLPMAI